MNQNFRENAGCLRARYRGWALANKPYVRYRFSPYREVMSSGGRSPMNVYGHRCSLYGVI